MSNSYYLPLLLCAVLLACGSSNTDEEPELASPLFDNSHSTTEVQAGTPEAPNLFFTPHVFEQLAGSPRGALALALRDVDRACSEVAAPTLLLSARGDQP